jgi:endonuclease/exonuclease/phosphatase family metal-dependent hydrolase
VVTVRPDMQIRVASWNIHKGVGLDRRRDPERILAVLKEIDADIVALQEADKRFGTRDAILSEMALFEAGWQAVDCNPATPSLGWHGNAIIARPEYGVPAVKNVELPTLEPRGAVRADFHVGEATVRVIGMHLDLSGLRRRQQIRTVLNHLADSDGDPPAVLMGDFNQWGDRSGAMQEFEGPWHVCQTGPTFPTRRPIACLDRIVISPEWHCRSTHVHLSELSLQASDHLPIVAEIELV